jgi:cobalt-zinc-cadmium efflux system outer membrane protein
VLTLVASASAPAWGAGAEAPLRVTADEAAARALKGNPTLQALRDERRRVEGTVVTASTLSNPQLELDWLHIQSVSYEKAWAAELSWAPPQPGVFGGRRRAAEANASATGHDVEELSFALELDVRAAHADLLSVVKKRGLVDEACRRRQEIVNLVTRRLAGGASTKLGLNLAELALAQMEAVRDDLAAAQLEKERALASLMGVASEVEAVGEDLPAVPAPPPLEALGASARAARPALKAEQARLGARQEDVGAVRAAAWPWIELGGRYRSNETREHADDWALSVQIKLPIFDRLQGPRASAAAARDQQETVLRGVEASVSRDLVFARAQVDLRQQNVARFKTAVLDSLSSRETLLSTAARGGQLDVVAWLAAEDVITRSRQTYVDLRLAETRAWLALERAVGRHLTQTSKEPEGGS